MALAETVAETPAVALAQPTAVESAAPRRRWLGLAVLLAGSFMTVLDAMIVQVALPSIAKDLGAGSATIELVIAGYGIAYGVLLVTGGRLGDLYGRKRVFLIGMGLFTLASILCGLAPNAPLLVLARVLQGATAALIPPQVYAAIRTGFAGDDRRRAFGLMGLVLGVAAALGELIGGVLITGDVLGLGWRLVFLVNLPIGVMAIAIGGRLLQESKSPAGTRLDPSGIALLTLALAVVLGAMVSVNHLGWRASAAMGLVAVPLLVLFARYETKFEERGLMPLFSLRLLRIPAFRTGALLVLAFFSTANAFYLALGVLLQFGGGMSPLAAGLVFTPMAAAYSATSFAVPVLMRRYGNATLRWSALLYGFAFVLLWLQTGPNAGFDIWLLMPALLLVGIGQGLLMTPLLNSVLSVLPEVYAGMAGGAVSTLQQVGNAFGVACLGLALFAHPGGAGVATLAGADAVAAFRNAMVLEIIGAALTWHLLHRFQRFAQV
ncbi:MAG TPA: MFS transporter [Candidatus Cybelea sp.]|nr:MFS transporter [Candidatus Cybelea sp.]